MKLKILFVSANPLMDLYLDEEYKAIAQGIKETEYRDYIEIEVRLACEYDNLMDAVNEEKPDIVHFSGHGEGERGLKFYSPDLENNTEDNTVSELLYDLKFKVQKMSFLQRIKFKLKK